jgi:hypothetical protein
VDFEKIEQESRNFMKRVSVRSLELVGSPKKGTKNIMLKYHKKHYLWPVN